MVAGYGSGAQVTPAVSKLTELMPPDLPVQDALRVEVDRYWSYTCQNVASCPPEGRQFQAENAATRTLRVAAGLSVEASVTSWPTARAPEEARAEAAAALTELPVRHHAWAR